jgi:hypothetical protein
LDRSNNSYPACAGITADREEPKFMLKENLVKHIEKSIRENWDLSALSDYHGQSLSYGKVAERIITIFFAKAI